MKVNNFSLCWSVVKLHKSMCLTVCYSIRKILFLVMEPQQQRNQMKAHLHSAIVEPRLFSYVQLRTNLRAFIYLMCNFPMHQCWLKQRRTVTVQYLPLYIFLNSSWLTNISYIRASVLFFFYFFCVFLNIICI